MTQDTRRLCLTQPPQNLLINILWYQWTDPSMDRSFVSCSHVTKAMQGKQVIHSHQIVAFAPIQGRVFVLRFSIMLIGYSHSLFIILIITAKKSIIMTILLLYAYPEAELRGTVGTVRNELPQKRPSHPHYWEAQVKLVNLSNTFWALDKWKEQKTQNL